MGGLHGDESALREVTYRLVRTLRNLAAICVYWGEKMNHEYWVTIAFKTSAPL
jgi:hypothetical protein